MQPNCPPSNCPQPRCPKRHCLQPNCPQRTACNHTACRHTGQARAQTNTQACRATKPKYPCRLQNYHSGAFAHLLTELVAFNKVGQHCRRKSIRAAASGLRRACHASASGISELPAVQLLAAVLLAVQLLAAVALAAVQLLAAWRSNCSPPHCSQPHRAGANGQAQTGMFTQYASDDSFRPVVRRKVRGLGIRMGLKRKNNVCP